MSDETYTCSVCQKPLAENETYEYRGAFACDEHFDVMQQNRDIERNEIIAAEDAKTRVFRGLDMGDSVIGKENRRLLSRQREVAGKESARLKAYEGR